MGSQEAEARETIRTAEQAERPSGASAAQIWDPEEGEPSGATRSDKTNDAEPKRDTSAGSRKFNLKAHTERPIGASAAQIWDPEEEKPKGATRSERTEDAEPKGDTRAGNHTFNQKAHA